MKKKLLLQVVAHLALLLAFSSRNMAVAGNGLLKNDAFAPYSYSLFSTLLTASPGGFNKIPDKNGSVSGTVKDQEGNALPGLLLYRASMQVMMTPTK